MEIHKVHGMNTSSKNTKDSLPQIAIIGCGMWGKNLVRNFAELGALSTLCDHNTDKANKLAKEYGVSSCTEDEVFQNANVDAVVISSIAPLHAEHAERALLAGKHVYVEKPMALSTKDAKKLCDLAKERNLVLMVGHILNYHPAFIALKENLPELGPLKHIYANRLGMGRFRDHESVLWDLATHDVSLILSLTQEMPKSVDVAWQSYLKPNKPSSALLTLNFSRELTAHVHTSWISPFKEQKLVVVGENGIAIFDDRKPWSDKLQISTDFLHIHDEKLRSNNSFETKTIPLTEGEPLKNECAHFLNCIQRNEEPLTSGSEGLRVTQIIEEAEQLYKRR